MKKTRYHVNPAVQKWEELNFHKLMQRRVQQARALVPLFRRTRSRNTDDDQDNAKEAPPAPFTTLSNGIRIPRLHLPAHSHSASPGSSSHSSYDMSDNSYHDVDDEYEDDGSYNDNSSIPHQGTHSKASFTSAKTTLVKGSPGQYSQHHGYHHAQYQHQHQHQHHHHGYKADAQQDHAPAQQPAGHAACAAKPIHQKSGLQQATRAAIRADGGNGKHRSANGQCRSGAPKQTQLSPGPSSKSPASSKAAPSLRDRPDFQVASTAELHQQWKNSQRSMAAQSRELWGKGSAKGSAPVSPYGQASGSRR